MLSPKGSEQLRSSLFVIQLRTYRLDKPSRPSKFEPAQMAAPGRSQHDSIGCLGHFLVGKSLLAGNLIDLVIFL